MTKPKSTSLSSPPGVSLRLLGLMSRAVYDGGLLTVEIHQRIGQLRSPSQHLMLRQELSPAPGLLDQRFQVLARHIIHDQIIAQPFAEEIGDLGQVGMVQPCQHRSLAQELLTGFF